MENPSSIKFAYFGTSQFSLTVLEELVKAGFIPSVVVTREDKPSGRNLLVTHSPIKLWAMAHDVKLLQPSNLKNEEFLTEFTKAPLDVSIVASYGKIIPSTIINFPKRKTLNVHPSLLPKLRGSSPIPGAILTETETGVTIIRLDEEMDHGPIITQAKVPISDWPPYAISLENILAKEGGKLLAEILPDWIGGNLTEKEQEHSKATFTKLIKKDDAEVDLKGDPQIALRKIRAYSDWPIAWTRIETKKGLLRVLITKAHIENGNLVIERVIPEGKKEMAYEDFVRGFLPNVS
jgi:methionyl-tRNA formyltransferase